MTYIMGANNNNKRALALFAETCSLVSEGHACHETRAKNQKTEYGYRNQNVNANILNHF